MKLVAGVRTKQREKTPAAQVMNKDLIHFRPKTDHAL